MIFMTVSKSHYSIKYSLMLCCFSVKVVHKITLTQKDFVIKEGKNGEHIRKVTDELTKNHCENNSSMEGGIIVVTYLCSCPVKSFKKSVSLLRPRNGIFSRKLKLLPSNQDHDSIVKYLS